MWLIPYPLHEIFETTLTIEPTITINTPQNWLRPCNVSRPDALSKAIAYVKRARANENNRNKSNFLKIFSRPLPTCFSGNGSFPGARRRVVVSEPPPLGGYAVLRAHGENVRAYVGDEVVIDDGVGAGAAT